MMGNDTNRSINKKASGGMGALLAVVVFLCAILVALAEIV